jgi:hypothetical protein
VKLAGRLFTKKGGRAMKTERGKLRFVLRRKPKVGLLLLMEQGWFSPETPALMVVFGVLEFLEEAPA